MSELDYDYFEIKIPCDKSEADEYEDFLLSLGACSVTYRDGEDMAILEPAPGEMPLWNAVEITAMFTTEYDEQSIVDLAKKRFPQSAIHCSRLKNQVWERTWLAHFKPMQFGQKTWVIPSVFDAIDEQAVNIYLDPGLAFGTGTHATTALCLEWIDSHKLTGLDVVDFGCGSGILAIAALKHGAKHAFCTDIDPQAIESTISNAKNNHVLTGVKVVETDDIKNLKQMDVVMANILAGPLISLVDTFKALLKPEGQLIMSGILAEQVNEIVQAFDQSFVDFEIKILEDWASVFCKRIKQ